MRSLLLFSFLAFCGVASAQIIDFPDANFKNALVNTKCVDTNGDDIGDADADLNDDGEIDVSEALLVEYLNVSSKQIYNLEGIGSFVNLIFLNCRYNNLSTLDLIDLKNMNELNCSSNKLTFLNTDGLTNLLSMNCAANQFINLNLQGMTNLVDLNCSQNKLVTLNVQGLPNLRNLNCYTNKLTSLDLQGLTNLTTLNCAYNQLSSLDLEALINLNEFDCKVNNISQLALENLSLLSRIDCRDNISLSSLTITNLPKLEYLNCSNTGISSLDLNNLPLLSTLNCSSNPSLINLNLKSLPKLRYLTAFKTKLISLDLIDQLELEDINCGPNNSLNSLSLKNLPKLLKIACSNTSLSILLLDDLPSLKNVICDDNKSLNTLSLTNLPKLSFLDCSNSDIISLNLKDLPSLATLNCEFNKKLNSLMISNLPKLMELNCSETIITSLDLQDLPFLTNLYCHSITSLKNLKLHNLPGLGKLWCFNSGILSLELNGLPNLVTLLCQESISLEKLILTNLPSLYDVNCINTKIASLDLNNLPSLSILECSAKSLVNLNLVNLPKLSNLKCSHSGYISLIIMDLPSLSTLDCQNNLFLNNLELVNLPKLANLNCSFSGLVSLELNDLPQLSNLYCSYSGSLNNLVLKKLPKLINVQCLDSGFNTFQIQDLPLLSTLDVSANYNLKELKLENLPKLKILKSYHLPTLISIEIISDALLSEFDIRKYPSLSSNLKYICISENNFIFVNNQLNSYGYTNVNVTNYCSFDPFSDFGVLSGKVVLDADNNGCDSNDKNLSTVKFDIVGPSKSGTFLFDGNNKYEISLLVGPNTITPKLENQGYTFSPEFLNLDIKKDDTITQDFCITPKGVFRQTNITVIPLTPPARPGFEAKYKIVWENVGNQIESGTLNFTYDETLLDYISATQTADQVVDGIVKWNFTNLLPFEKREIIVTLKVNRPTDTPAVNAGDKLYLTASILDNIFTLENTVVGSYDPNDKTCLQGDRVKPDMVGEYVDYLIRFENTGNYAAENIVVKDIIDTKTFDVSTLKITDASHEVYTRIEGNKVEFIFENIQLPFDDANNDGYIAFKIKTLPSLVLGDSLKNLADIYFDYNFPIRTNEAQTTVAFPVFTKDITTEVNIYPNPVTDILYLDTKENWTKAEIYDISGRIMRSASLDGQSIDVGELESGTYFIRLKDGEKVGLVKFVKM